MPDDRHHLVDLCANVQRSFDHLSAFAEEHDLSVSAVTLFVLVGSLNIRTLDGVQMLFEPVTPAQIARSARMEPKTVSRWCTQLMERDLLRRHKGAYAIERFADWYRLAGCLQSVALPPLPGLATPSYADELAVPVRVSPALEETRTA